VKEDPADKTDPAKGTPVEMNGMEQSTDVLVIGAGMAGLIAATELQRAGRRVLVLDKGRSAGGRMASRRIGGATFDHGAQFITSRDRRFTALLEEARHQGGLEEWGRGFDGHSAGEARWRGKPTMSALPGHLALGLDLQLETHVVALRPAGDRWSIQTEAGRIFTAPAVVLTPPVPQSLAMLDMGEIVLPPDLRTRLQAIEYTRCLTVLAVLDGPSRLPVPGDLAPADGPIVWIADNQLKGVSHEPAVTIHATHAFSLAHWDRDRLESGRTLLDAAGPWLGTGIRTFQVHGWRYSKPMRVAQEPCVVVSRKPTLVLAGDAFGGPRVEGAALSGWAAAEAILNQRDASPVG